MPGEIKHALLSASSAERWLNCPGSVHLTKDMPDTTSPHAEEGSLAHAIAEVKLNGYFTTESHNPGLNDLKKHPLYKTEMQEYTDEYVDYINQKVNGNSRLTFVTIEDKVDFSEYVPDGFGTADCVLISGSVLQVVDFKYGKGVLVTAQNNPQLKLYALGCLLKYNMLFDIKEIHMAIVQPRGGGIKETSITAQELLDWAENEVKPKAKSAYDGVPEYNCGSWCRFCKAAGRCKNRANGVLSPIEEFKRLNPDTGLLNAEDFAELLPRIEPLMVYAKAAKATALKMLLDGDNIPGYKLVAGRSTRVWASQEDAFNKLNEAGVDDVLLWHREPYTLPQIEKQIGKKKFNEITEGLVIKTPGSPTIAPQSDSRKAITTIKPEEDFEGLTV